MSIESFVSGNFEVRGRDEVHVPAAPHGNGQAQIADSIQISVQYEYLCVKTRLPYYTYDLYVTYQMRSIKRSAALGRRLAKHASCPRRARLAR